MITIWQNEDQGIMMEPQKTHEPPHSFLAPQTYLWCTLKKPFLDISVLHHDYHFFGKLKFRKVPSTTNKIHYPVIFKLRSNLSAQKKILQVSYVAVAGSMTSLSPGALVKESHHQTSPSA